MKKRIRLTESTLHRIIKESVKRVLREWEDPDTSEYEGDEELSYDMAEFKKAMQKSNGTYHAKSSDGRFQTGDKVIVHGRNGDFEGIISDFDTNFMTYEEEADVEIVRDGRNQTLMGVPLDKIEKI